MTGYAAAAVSCELRQASRQPHPLPTRRSRSPDAVMLRITSSGLPGPLPSAPRGAPSCVIVPQSRHSPSLRDGTVTALGSRFLSSFTSAAGRPRFARTPRSRAHFPSPPGPRRRTLRGDCFAPASCRTFLFSLLPVPADFALLRLPRPGVIAAVTVTRLPLRSGRDRSPRCFFCWCSGRQQTRAAP